MKKCFFTSSCRLLQITSVLFLTSGASLDAMTGSKFILSLVINGGARMVQLTPRQSHYATQGKEKFLQDLSEGTIPHEVLAGTARLFTKTSYISAENYMRLFRDKADAMDEIKNSAKNNPAYAQPVATLAQEFEQDCFEFARTAIDIDASLVSEIVKRVPSVLTKAGVYLHGYTAREGTLLDYVEDETAEAHDKERLDMLKTIKEGLVVSGAKKFAELCREKKTR